MKRVYSHDNHFYVFNIRNILENNGIRCEVRNDIMSSAAGEVPPTEVWPEVWVVREVDYEKAERLIHESLHVNSQATSWLCRHCQETNAPSFELCWQCGTERLD